MSGKKYISAYCVIENNRIVFNGNTIFEAADLPFGEFSKQAYQQAGISYPKFFKMDNLSRLAFLAAEMVLKDEVHPDAENNIALLFANSSSSLDTDVKHSQSISDKENFYPSPAVFVYTLPNICLGEISIRHKLYTENSFFIFADFNPEFFANYAAILLDTKKADKVLCGWAELYKDSYKAFVYMVSDKGETEHTIENIQTLYKK